MCDCETKVNNELKPFNGRLAISFLFVRECGLLDRLTVVVEKINKKIRKPLPVITVKFCPFCGEKK